MTDLINSLVSGDSKTDDAWISVSDMMTGLMMIFLFIAIIYIQEVLNTYGEFEDVQAKICSELKKEFNEEQDTWDMRICEGGLLVKFQNNENFLPDSKVITDRFQIVLGEFYPRFKRILWKYIDDVDELRIEGHASSEARGKTRKDAYLYNTELSQGISFNVMDYVLGLENTYSVSDKLDIKEVGKLIAQLKKSRAVFEPIDSIQEKQRFRLTEYPMHLSVYRGGCVNDCSTDSSRFFILMPNEFTFYVERINKGGSSEFIGYVSASLVFADGEKTLLIKDVAGSKSLDTYFLKEVIEGFMSLKEYYGVKRIALMSTDFVKNNHDSKQVKALRDFINTYTLEQANYVRFPDNKLRLALEKYNKYDLERYHQRINIIRLTRRIFPY